MRIDSGRRVRVCCWGGRSFVGRCPVVTKRGRTAAKKWGWFFFCFVCTELGVCCRTAKSRHQRLETRESVVPRNGTWVPIDRKSTITILGGAAPCAQASGVLGKVRVYKCLFEVLAQRLPAVPRLTPAARQHQCACLCRLERSGGFCGRHCFSSVLNAAHAPGPTGRSEVGQRDC